MEPGAPGSRLVLGANLGDTLPHFQRGVSSSHASRSPALSGIRAVPLGSLGFARDAFDKLSISACGSNAAQTPQFRQRAQTPARRLNFQLLLPSALFRNGRGVRRLAQPITRISTFEGGPSKLPLGRGFS